MPSSPSGARGAFRAAWLRQRAISELLRQWLTVEYLLAAEEAALTHRIETLRAAWDEAIARSPAALIEAVAKLAYVRLDELTATLGATVISDNALRTYYAARPQRQTSWFTSSLERIEQGRHVRERLMAATFLSASAAACVKLLSLLLQHETAAQIAMLVLLICIGLAGASSSAYLGQNQRSLKHRYAQQLREIREWCSVSAQDGLVAHLNGPGPSSGTAIVRDIRAFEKLMANELLDWLSISTDDAMELAPS